MATHVVQQFLTSAR